MTFCSLHFKFYVSGADVQTTGNTYTAHFTTYRFIIMKNVIKIYLAQEECMSHMKGSVSAHSIGHRKT